VPLIQSTPLEALFDPKPMERSATRMAKAAGDLLHDEVVRRTPIASLPPGVTALMRGRKPGTLRASWKTSEVEGGGKLKPLNKAQRDKRAVEEYTEDPIGPLVEYPTRPHIIRPRLDRAPASVIATKGPRRLGTDPRARLRFVNRFGRVVYAAEVHHPGTQGVHMMRDALSELDATWVDRVGKDEVERWAHEQLRNLR
jgi:hypothetical protein